MQPQLPGSTMVAPLLIVIEPPSIALWNPVGIPVPGKVVLNSLPVDVKVKPIYNISFVPPPEVTPFIVAGSASSEPTIGSHISSYSVSNSSGTVPLATQNEKHPGLRLSHTRQLPGRGAWTGTSPRTSCLFRPRILSGCRRLLPP